jgi:hypothetical protein
MFSDRVMAKAAPADAASKAATRLIFFSLYLLDASTSVLEEYYLHKNKNDEQGHKYSDNNLRKAGTFPFRHYLVLFYTFLHS